VFTGIGNFLRARRGKKEFLALSDAERKIVFYAEDTHSWIHFNAIIKELIERGEACICYLTSDPSDPVFDDSRGQIKPFYIGEGSVRTTLFIQLRAKLLIMTMPDLETYYIKRSKVFPVHYVYIFHAMVSTHSNYRKAAFDHFDTIFCTGPYQIDEIRATEKVYGLPPKQLHEVGYRRLEALIEDVQAYRAQRGNALPVDGAKTVIVAPTWGEHAILEVCGEELVEHLLSAGYHVILRPHPMTVKTNPTIVESIRRRFEAMDAFRLQIDVRDKTTLYESDFMICDWSGVAMEYAFSCERPVIFIDVPKKLRNPEADTIGITPIEVSIRTEIGIVVAPGNIASLQTLIEEFAYNEEEYSNRIRSLREKYVFNLGYSTGVAATKILELAA
jgi:YidC/Oxa1 family membrane protein insertase